MMEMLNGQVHHDDKNQSFNIVYLLGYATTANLTDHKLSWVRHSTISDIHLNCKLPHGRSKAISRDSDQIKEKPVGKWQV